MPNIWIVVKEKLNNKKSKIKNKMCIRERVNNISNVIVRKQKIELIFMWKIIKTKTVKHLKYFKFYLSFKIRKFYAIKETEKNKILQINKILM